MAVLVANQILFHQQVNEIDPTAPESEGSDALLRLIHFFESDTLVPFYGHMETDDFEEKRDSSYRRPKFFK